MPLTWIKTGGSEQQHWLLAKEGKIYFRFMFRSKMVNSVRELSILACRGFSGSTICPEVTVRIVLILRLL